MAVVRSERRQIDGSRAYVFSRRTDCPARPHTHTAVRAANVIDGTRSARRRNDWPCPVTSSRILRPTTNGEGSNRVENVNGSPSRTTDAEIESRNGRFKGEVENTGHAFRGEHSFTETVETGSCVDFRFYGTIITYV